MKVLSEDWPCLFPEVERSLVVAYVLWMVWGVLGVHKFYPGKITMGFLYLLTGGPFGLGWFPDLFPLPRQVKRFRERVDDADGAEDRVTGPGRRLGAAWPFSTGTREGRVKRLPLRKAMKNRGVLTVTEGVMRTGLPCARVEAALREMA